MLNAVCVPVHCKKSVLLLVSKKNGPYEGRTHDLRVISTAL